MPQLIQLRRQMLRFARSLPPGPERNGRRQIAASLRSLVRNTKWLAAHTIEAPVKEYRVYTVDTEGHFIKTIKLDCPDDASATDSARQFIDGLDIELWQLDRKVATFEHKPKKGRLSWRGLFEQRGPMMMVNNSTPEFERLLGKAALALWSDFPRDVQENLFETAVAGDVIIRNHLASYLHDHHPKTAHPALKLAQSAERSSL
jgi:hypothetical protein